MRLKRDFLTMRPKSFFESISKYKWNKILCEGLRNCIKKCAASNLHIGVIGALGSNDVGDEAMLCSMMNDIRSCCPNVKFTIFSNRPEITSAYLGINTEPTPYRLLNNRNNFLSWIFHLINKIEYLISYILKNLFGLKETSCGGWFFRICYLVIDQYICHIARKFANGKTLLPRNLLNRHLISLKDIDALVFLGGGYINSWHVKENIYPYLFSAKAAIILSKPVFASGINLGPFNSFDSWQVRKVIKDFKLIGVRDSNESFKILKDMRIDMNKCHFSSDDAITLKASSLESKYLEDFARNSKPYLSVQVHLWLLKKKQSSSLINSLANVLDNIIIELGWNVMMIPMQFGVEPVKDRVTMECIKEMSRYKNNIIMAPESLKPEQLKLLFSHGVGTLCTRHHSMVFSLSEGVPTIVIELDEYYRMKLFGVAQEFSNMCKIIPINQKDLGKIILDNILNIIKK